MLTRSNVPRQLNHSQGWASYKPKRWRVSIWLKSRPYSRQLTTSANVRSGPSNLKFCRPAYAASGCRSRSKAGVHSAIAFNALALDAAPVPRPTQLNPDPGHFARRESTWYRCAGTDPPNALTAWHASCGLHLQSALGRARFGAYFSKVSWRLRPCSSLVGFRPLAVVAVFPSPSAQGPVAVIRQRPVTGSQINSTRR